MQNMDKLSHQYVAGLFDGEGCFCIYQQSVGSKVRTFDKYFTAQAVVEIRQKEITLLLQKNYGGTITFKRRRKAQHADTWVWTLRNNQLLNSFIQVIEPYLVIKSQQAKVISKFLKIRSGKASKRLTEQEREQQLACKEQLNQLNTKG